MDLHEVSSYLQDIAYDRAHLAWEKWIEGNPDKWVINEEPITKEDLYNEQ